MNNSLLSQIGRGLKISTSYAISLILFGILVMPILSIAKDNTPQIMPFFSFLLFWVLFYLVYIEMRVLAFKEKRPQYNINPSPYKGIFYGVIGILPLVIIELILILVKVPKDYTQLMGRIYQGFAAPLYWFAKLIGNAPIHYVLSFVLVIVAAFLGYFAGHKDFMLVSVLRKKLGIKSTPKKPVKEKQKR